MKLPDNKTKPPKNPLKIIPMPMEGGGWRRSRIRDSAEGWEQICRHMLNIISCLEICPW